MTFRVSVQVDQWRTAASCGTLKTATALSGCHSVLTTLLHTRLL